MAQTDGPLPKPTLFPGLATGTRRLYKAFFEPVTFVLAIVAIGFALKQYFDARELVNKVEGILGAASTRYIDAFPEDISGIREIVSRTCADLDIMVSIPGYGQYSSPSDFDEYKMAIEAVVNSKITDNRNAKKCLGKTIRTPAADDAKAHVRLLLFTPDQRKSNMRDQFGEEFLGDLRTNPGNQSKFISFFKKNPMLIDVPPENYLEKILREGRDDFLEKLEKEHRWNEEIFHHDLIEIKYSKEPYSIYLWLQDDHEAAFSFDRRHARTLITFRTSDPKLLDTFRLIFKSVWDEAKPYDEYWREVAGNK
jgi:hypothetical protein